MYIPSTDYQHDPLLRVSIAVVPDRSGPRYVYQFSVRYVLFSGVSWLLQPVLLAMGLGEITTEIVAAPDFYFAEDYHQQYLAKNVGGYCGLGGVGARLPEGWTESVSAA